MFKERYIQDNESINLNETAKEAIKEQLRSSSEKSRGRFAFKKVVATVLAVCLILGVVLVVGQSAPAFTSTPEKTLVASVTYDDIYDSISEIIKEQNRKPGFFDSVARFFGFGGDDMEMLNESEVVTDVNNAVMDGATTGTSKDSALLSGVSDDGTESSSTNNQVSGVDEADIVKNDGRYIYSISHGKLIITDTNSGSPIKVSETRIEKNNMSVINMYVSGDRLAVISSGYYDKGSTAVTVYSIADKAAPFEMATVSQSGAHHSSRMIDGTVYLISNYYIYGDSIDRDRPEQYVPCVNSKPIAAEDLSMIDDFKAPTYLVISAVDMLTAQSGEKSAVLGGAENIYCTNEHLYYTFTNYEYTDDGPVRTSGSTTTIVKLSIKKDDIKNLATGSVAGYPLNQFSMDEYKGNLRIVTTINKTVTDGIVYSSDSAVSNSETSSVLTTTSNALYVLDKDLKVIGSAEDLGKDERVYSVRFDREVGYFVTFRETDPLFTVDLSDPKNPTVMSALKIPGFSEYLHPYGEGLLFGFGKEATESGSVTGLKLSMYDVSDPYDVTEADKELLDADYSDASYDHKAIMVDARKNIIAFTAYSYGGEAELYVYGYDKETGFVLKNNSVIEGANYLANCRFVYIGDYFYLVSGTGISTFSLSTFSQLGHLNF